MGRDASQDDDVDLAMSENQQKCSKSLEISFNLLNQHSQHQQQQDQQQEQDPNMKDDDAGIDCGNVKTEHELQQQRQEEARQNQEILR